MTDRDQMAAFLDDALDGASRDIIENALEHDEETLRFVIEQRKMDRALRSILGAAERKQRLKESILAALAGASAEQLRTQVLAETSGHAPDSAVGRGTPWDWLLAWFGLGRPGLELSILHRFAASLVLFTTVLGVYFLSISERQPQPIEIGQFTALTGQPTLRHHGHSLTFYASRFTPVFLGDRIETADADRAEIQFHDGTTLRLGFNTTLEIPTPNFQLPTSNSSPLRPPEINLLAGQIWTKVAKLTNAPQYAVRTPAATAIARGTEFGVKLSGGDRSQKLGVRSQESEARSQTPTPNSQLLSPNSHLPSSNLVATLTVKEGAVDFTNSFGMVQATAMTESTARNGSAPTEPKRLQTLQVVQIAPGASWSLVTSALTLPDAAEKLVGGGGWVGFALREFATGTNAPASAGAAASNEVRVARVFQNSPAGCAGLQPGDVLLAFDGSPVTNASQIERTILLRPNNATTLKLRRGEEEKLVTLSITNRSTILPGPALSLAQRTQLANLTREWVEMPTPPSTLLTPREPVDLGARTATSASLEKRVRADEAVHAPNGGAAQQAQPANLTRELVQSSGTAPAPGAANRKMELKLNWPASRAALAVRDNATSTTTASNTGSNAPIGSDTVKFDARARRTTPGAGVLPRTVPVADRRYAVLARLPGGKSGQALRAAAENNLGVIFESEDTLGPAIRAYGRAVYLDAQAPLYRFNLALALRKIGSFERAEEELEAAARLAPTSTEPRKWLANTRSLLGGHAEALSQTEALLALAPRDHSLWELKAQLLTKLSRFAESLAAARKAVELESDCPTAHAYLAGAFTRLGNLREAETSYQRALDLAPFDALHHMDLGVVLRNRGQVASAERRFRKAIELRPDLVVAYDNLGLLYASTRRDAQAEETFRKAIEVDPDNVEILRKLIYLAAESGRLDEAETRARRVLELAPHESGSHNDLGEVLRQKGKFDEAIQSYRKALELKPNAPGVLNNIAIIQAMRGQHAQAEKTFRTLVDLAAKDTRINPINFLVNLAMVCNKQSKLDDAEKFYRQALALDSNDPGICNSLAAFLADHQLKLDEALTLARRAVQTAPNDPNYLDTLGWVLFQRGDLDEAEKLIKKALEIAPQSPSAAEIREHLKKVADKKGTLRK
jgi:tetratricopeptide (TPR) repeat protein